MVPYGVWTLTRLLSPRLYLPRVFPIRTDLSVENSQTLAFGSPPDISHLPTISGEGFPQPAIASSKTAMAVITNWNLYRTNLNDMTTGFSLARAQSWENARPSHPLQSCKISLWRDTSSGGLIGLLYLQRSEKLRRAKPFRSSGYPFLEK